jgi:hypothetical protein
MGTLITLIILGLILWWALSGRGKVDTTEQQLEQRNLEWAKFIAGYKKQAKNKDQSELINKMLADIKSSGLPVDDDLIELDEHNKVKPLQNHMPTIYGDSNVQTIINTTKVDNNTAFKGNKAYLKEDTEIIDKNDNIDGPSLLLYFGAFLFIASAGLFVSFGQFAGILKTFIVVLLVASLYALGLWLNKNNPKFAQVGLTFAGIGLAIAPLVGLTAYNYVFNESSGSIVWFLTSLACLGLYAHAMFTLKKPLINYIFIFTFLSLFESAVSIINAPIYYFGWGLALVGIINLFIAKYADLDQEFKDASNITSLIFLPLALMLSIVLLPTHGTLQLAVSLFLGALYYILQAYSEQNEPSKSSYGLAGHIASVASIGLFYYAFDANLANTAIVLATTNILQLVIYLFIKSWPYYNLNFVAVIIGLQIIAFLMALSEPKIALINLILLFLFNYTFWLKYKFSTNLILSMIIVPFASLYISIAVINKPLELVQIAYNLLLAVFVLYIFYGYLKSKLEPDLSFALKAIIIVSTLLVIILSVFSQQATNLLIISYIALAVTYLASLVFKDKDFALSTGLFITLPIIRFAEGSQYLAYSAIVASLFNIYGALKYRHELFRWVGSIVWFVLPVALNSGFNLNWHANMFALVYFVTAIGFIMARAIARGAVFANSNIPLVAYDRNQSLSYVVGYLSALFLSAIIAIASSSDISQSITAIIFCLISITTYVLARYVEKSDYILSAIPILIQFVIYFVLLPNKGGISYDVYSLFSIAIALLSYYVGTVSNFKQDAKAWFLSTSLITTYTLPLFSLFTDYSVIAPFSLIIAGALTVYQFWGQGIGARELSGSVVGIAIIWVLNNFGVNEFQVYSHVLAGQLAIYAYFRYKADQLEASQNYVLVALAVATIPLIIQSLNSQAGGLYGWWLLLEQVVFMLIGLAINNKLMTFWGLWVALGAVLYQLRGLGWASLTLLAMVIIGIAVYQISKNNDNQTKT